MYKFYVLVVHSRSISHEMVLEFSSLFLSKKNSSKKTSEKVVYNIFRLHF
jgi:hypothetical protein